MPYKRFRDVGLLFAALELLVVFDVRPDQVAQAAAVAIFHHQLRLPVIVGRDVAVYEIDNVRVFEHMQ